MRKTILSLSLAMLYAAGCGGDGSTIDIVGKTPTEAANEVADAICDQNVACGDVSVDCMSTQDGLDCTGTIEPVTYMECYDELQMEIESDFTDCALTDAQKEKVNECINALLARPCITQGELDAYATAIENGDETATLGDPPPAVCEEIDGFFEACQPQ